jgi:hypothetical protein
VIAREWGVFEYWNIGTVTLELVDFGKTQNWPFPKDPASLIGQNYRVAQCFVYHLDGERGLPYELCYAGSKRANSTVDRGGQRAGK